ncbi:hypothetical protein, conserved [Eimeria tenella]|uniref:Uncharacterized protein n=1 Tax=Eimeria tenella TaxID=5802 RepID=U6KHU6_EIMTE|nr:hypothetical protein, conserved [Eimeria tenella]CDJ37610.1 hypothetical protein, conserved [Eimeria tenella]|eukprot:XP_013228448.1 hypothetical protein, conserved [Eimeria tenella]
MPEIHGNAQPISCTVSNAVGHLFLFKYESKNGIFVQQSRCAASETSSALLRNQPLAAHRKTAGTLRSTTTWVAFTRAATKKRSWRKYTITGAAAPPQRPPPLLYHSRRPVVAALDAPDALFLYEDGFFDVKPSDHGKLCDSPNKGLTGLCSFLSGCVQQFHPRGTLPGWEYTNHAIAIVGWGEDP